ncbi:hypothetical protein Dimus_037327 [Dionaea muscipula]
MVMLSRAKEVRVPLRLVQALGVCVCAIILPSVSNSAARDSDPVVEHCRPGHGYVVQWAAAQVGNCGEYSMTALLRLIRESSIYGPDVEFLKLTARYTVPTAINCFSHD